MVILFQNIHKTFRKSNFVSKLTKTFTKSFSKKMNLQTFTKSLIKRLMKRSVCYLCNWCHKRLDENVCALTYSYLDDNKEYSKFCCSEYCLDKTKNMNEAIYKWDSSNEKQCLTCGKNTDTWTFIIYNTHAFCSYLHIEMYYSNKFNELISKKKKITEDLLKINTEFSEAEKLLKKV